MRLIAITIENFRCYRAPLRIAFEDFTALVGKNDAGKSTVMEALAVFFDDALEKGDASVGGDAKRVSITCEFDQLPTSLILDADFETSLADEYLLDNNGCLQIRKIFDASLEKPKLASVAAIALHPTTDKYHDLLHLKQKDLLKRADDLDVNLEAVDKAANAPVRRAIWQSCQNLNRKLTDVTLDKEGAKQAWDRLSEIMPEFALFKSDRSSSDQDEEAQDPLKTAVREAIAAVEPELQKIRDKVELEVRKIATATLDKIREMDSTLAATLDPRISHKKFDSLFSTSLTGDDGIPINKRGSGVRRLVLLNFFRARAEQSVTESKRSIIYAVEEPETSQHPRNQRMLLSALRDLAGTPGRQVIITTHTPMLARALPESALRYVDVTPNGARQVKTVGGQDTQHIADSLGVLPDHSVKLFIGVEGKHDIEFLRRASKVFLAGGIKVPDLEALELAGEIIFVPCGGSSLALWASRLSPLLRPELHLCDRDNAPPAQPKYNALMTAVNARQGCIAYCTTKREMENYLHHDAIVAAYAQHNVAIAFGAPFNDFDDVPLLVAQQVHLSQTPAVPFPVEPDKIKSKTGRAKEHLNKSAIALMTVQRFQQSDPANEILQWLLDAGEMLTFDN